MIKFAGMGKIRMVLGVQSWTTAIWGRKPRARVSMCCVGDTQVGSPGERSGLQV